MSAENFTHIALKGRLYPLFATVTYSVGISTGAGAPDCQLNCWYVVFALDLLLWHTALQYPQVLAHLIVMTARCIAYENGNPIVQLNCWKVVFALHLLLWHTALQSPQVLAHLIVLTASCISFFAWIDAKYNWQVFPVHTFHFACSHIFFYVSFL